MKFDQWFRVELDPDEEPVDLQWLGESEEAADSQAEGDCEPS